MQELLNEAPSSKMELHLGILYSTIFKYVDGSCKRLKRAFFGYLGPMNPFLPLIHRWNKTVVLLFSHPTGWKRVILYHRWNWITYSWWNLFYILYSSVLVMHHNLLISWRILICNCNDLWHENCDIPIWITFFHTIYPLPFLEGKPHEQTPQNVHALLLTGCYQSCWEYKLMYRQSQTHCETAVESHGSW